MQIFEKHVEFADCFGTQRQELPACYYNLFEGMLLLLQFLYKGALNASIYIYDFCWFV